MFCQAWNAAIAARENGWQEREFNEVRSRSDIDGRLILCFLCLFNQEKQLWFETNSITGETRDVKFEEEEEQLSLEPMTIQDGGDGGYGYDAEPEWGEGGQEEQPAGWQEFQDEDSGRPYWYNSTTDVTTWDNPN